MVQPAEEPAAGHLVLNEINAFPGGLRTGAVCHPEKNAGDELNAEGKGQGAAPNVTPARSTRHIFIKRFMRDFAVPGSVVQPVENFSHVTGVFSALPVRKFWN